MWEPNCKLFDARCYALAQGLKDLLRAIFHWRKVRKPANSPNPAFPANFSKTGPWGWAHEIGIELANEISDSSWNRVDSAGASPLC